MSFFPKLGSSAEAQSEANEIKSVWSAESVLIIRLLIYCAHMLEKIYDNMSRRPFYGGGPG